jgi:hypothetical protein
MKDEAGSRNILSQICKNKALKKREIKMKKAKMICLILIIVVLTSCNNMNSNKRYTPETASIPAETENEKKEQDFLLNYSESIDGIVQIRKTIGDSIKYGFADSDRNIIVEPVYDDSKFYVGASSASSSFNEGLAPVKKDGRWGYIDLKGKVAIDFLFDDARCFNEGLAPVKLNGKYGYINNKGKVIIDCMYENSSGFHKGVAVVEDNENKFGFINNKGAWLIKPEYDSVYFGRFDYEWTKNNVVTIQKGDLWGVAKILDGKVEIIVKPKYSKLYPYRNNKAQFEIVHKDKDGNYTLEITEGYIDEFGVEIVSWDYID